MNRDRASTAPTLPALPQTEALAPVSQAEAVLLLLQIVLATALALHNLGSKSLWTDEAVSVCLSRDWAVIWRCLHAGEFNMVLYYCVLHFWLGLGSDEWVVRSLSMVFAVATVPAMFLLGRRLFGARVGLTASLLLIVNGFFIQYAQEARSYSLYLLLSVLSCYLFVGVVAAPGWREVALYPVCTALAPLAHVFALLLPFAQACSLCLLEPRLVPWRRLTAAALATALVLVASLVVMRPGPSGTIDWLASPGLRPVLRLFYNFSSWSVPVAVAYAALGMHGLRHGLRPPYRQWSSWRYSFLLTMFLLPIVTSLAYSLAVTPVFFPRYLLGCLPPMLLLVASGIGCIQRPVWRWAVLAAVVAGSACGVSTCYGFQNEEWRGAVAFVAESAKDGDTVAFCPRGPRVSFEYYFDRLETRPRLRLLDVSSGDQLRSDKTPWASSDPADQCLAAEIPHDSARVWLVMNHERLGRLDRIEQSLLSGRYALISEWQFPGIRVLLYQRPAM